MKFRIRFGLGLTMLLVGLFMVHPGLAVAFLGLSFVLTSINSALRG